MKKITAFLLGFGFLFCSSFALAVDVNFQWGASTGVVDGYRIYYGDSLGGPYPEQLCEVNGTTLDYTASLNEIQEYYLVCRAFNNYGESKNSNEVHWSYIPPPGMPGDFYWIINLGQIGQVNIQFASEGGAIKCRSLQEK